MKEEKKEEKIVRSTNLTKNPGHMFWEAYQEVTDLAEDIEWDFEFTKLESMNLATKIINVGLKMENSPTCRLRRVESREAEEKFREAIKRK